MYALIRKVSFLIKNYWVYPVAALVIWSIVDQISYKVPSANQSNVTFLMTEPRWMYWIHCYTSDAVELTQEEKEKWKMH